MTSPPSATISDSMFEKTIEGEVGLAKISRSVFRCFEFTPWMIAKSAIMCKRKVLSMSANPEEWSDDDIVFVLSHAGSDVSGNLLLGDDACRRGVRTRLAPPEPVSEANLGEHYANRAQDG